MNEKTVKLLEFEEILKRVARCSMSEEAAEMILAEKPAHEADAVMEMRRNVSAVFDRLKSGDEEKRSSLPVIGFLLPKLTVEGTSLETDEVYAIGLFVERGEELKKFLLPGFPRMMQSLPDCSSVAKEVFRVVDRDGALRDLPEFRAIKRHIQNLTAELESSVSRYTGNEETRRMLQSAVPSQRDGRMVLAVKANYRGRFRGIVHEVSSTGQTIFVEPEEVVEKNNDILIEERRLSAEILRVLRELTGRIRERAEDLARFHEEILKLECLRARARYSLEIRGYFAQSGAELVLKEARHPLLGSKAVPIDLEMDGETRTVIITGPNTGGKTVALKTVGLFALMNQSGLALPAAEGTVLPIFDGVYADIGDEQSLSQSLSTFSAHMTNIAAIVSVATADSLILLDELGSGTDPEEGSALAMALLDCLIEKRSRLIVTTHHGVLKNYGYTRPSVENASMEFDGRTLSPTYRIVMGIPGESRALDIAGRNGLDPAIVARARSYLDEGRSDVSTLIAALKEKHRELDSATGKARVEELRLREERRSADLKELKLRQKEAEIKAGAVANLRGLLSESRKSLENLVREIREGELSREKTLRVKEFLSDLSRTVEAEDAALDEERRLLDEERRRVQAEMETEKDAEASRAEKKGGALPALRPGLEVLAGENRRRGRLIRKDRKGWIVEIGSLKMSFSETELVPLPPDGKPAKPLISTADLASPPDVQFELSLRGMRLDEALEALRKQIDAAVLSGLKEFSVVHGKGEGILQKGVHDYLKREPAVSDYYFSRPEMGGFGRTEVILKN
ncbi:MAG: endonuclease MutS2 [Treponema sp.]|jgi:DNA mismatch repair protein MutS2|nr:endonuclease MutS2 [Treponema sp.]